MSDLTLLDQPSTTAADGTDASAAAARAHFIRLQDEQLTRYGARAASTFVTIRTPLRTRFPSRTSTHASRDCACQGCRTPGPRS